jgi:hypothetical protein
MPRKRTSENELVVSAGSASLPARHKPVSRTRSKRPASPVGSAVEDQNIVAQDVGPAGTTEPAHEEIARLAYSYWEGRGFQGGSPEEDWLRAQQELRVRTAFA